jgi:hypothetical protein
MADAANEPTVFIGSSSEGEEHAHGFKEVLEENGGIVARHWRDVMAAAQSQTVIEVLVGALDEYDFGVFILSKDDVLSIRGDATAAPRDNVILELGLFTGRLGRERTFIAAPADFDIRVATDLLGVNLGAYTADDNRTSAARTPARYARERILKLGPRAKGTVTGASAMGAPPPSEVAGEPLTERHPRVRARPADPGDGWIEAARSGLLVPLGDGQVEPGDWVASAKTGLAQIIEVLPPVEGSSMLIRLLVDGNDRPVFVTEDRLFRPQFRSRDVA